MDPSSQNGTGEDVLAGAIDSIAEAYEGIHARVEEKQSELTTLKEEQGRLARALRALAPDHPVLPEPAGKTKRGPGRPPKQGGDTYERVQPDSLDAVWAWVSEQGNESFTQADAGLALDGRVSRPSVSKSLALLRSGEAIRFMGRTAIRGGKSDTFRLLDLEAGERTCATNRAEYKGPGKGAGPKAASAAAS